MWIFTTQGFYSAVQHREDPDTLIVRARTRDDIDALREQIPSLDPYEDPSADYRWRAEVARLDWLSALTQIGAEVDYDNFKNAVAQEQGHERAGRYNRVWGVMRRLQEEE